jgi:hypothetical protein
LTLISRAAPNWGEPLQEDLMALLENFANSTPPGNPTYGQVWYDTSASPGELKVFTLSGAWAKIILSGSEVGSTAGIVPPVPAIEGRLWYDTNTNPGILKVFHNGSWIVVSDLGCFVSSVAPVNPTEGKLWLNNSTNVLSVFTNGAWLNVYDPNTVNSAISTAINNINFAIPVQATAPTSTGSNLWYDNSSHNQLMVNNGSTWVQSSNLIGSTPKVSSIYKAMYRGEFTSYTYNLSLCNQHFGGDPAVQTSSYPYVANVTGDTILVSPEGGLTKTAITNIGIINVDITPLVDSYVTFTGYHTGACAPAFHSGQIVFYIDVLIDGVRIGSGTPNISNLWVHPTPGIGSYDIYLGSEGFTLDLRNFSGMLAVGNQLSGAIFKAGVKKTVTIKWMPAAAANYSLAEGLFETYADLKVQPI